MSTGQLTRAALGPSIGVSRVAKRSIDIVAAALGLFLLAPVMLLVALSICATSPGSPVFRQRRIGLGGREFVMWKFRTMVAGAEEMWSELLVHSRDPGWLHLDRDPRVTRLGRLLRRTSVDELPQLLNVLRGDMSLVGPRPLPPEEHAGLPDWARVRVAVRPGLTGLWQVMGRTHIDFLGMLELDREYAREPSLWTDAKILFLTIPAVLTRRGAN